MPTSYTRPPKSNPEDRNIGDVFPGAQSNTNFVKNVKKVLSQYGYTEDNTLVATSLCCDEVCRALERDVAACFGDNFSMGGLAGFAFCGVTSFCAMSAHIPDNGNCIIIYGPHVGVSSNGDVGTVERRGKEIGGSCCGSAVAASQFVDAVYQGKSDPSEIPCDPEDAMQQYVVSMLLPYMKRLADANERNVELPYVLYEAQGLLIQKILAKAAKNAPDGCKIALIGGIQINTPENQPDGFAPLSFKLLNNKNEVEEDLLKKLKLEGENVSTERLRRKMSLMQMPETMRKIFS